MPALLEEKGLHEQSLLRAGFKESPRRRTQVWIAKALAFGLELTPMDNTLAPTKTVLNLIEKHYN